MPHQFYTVQAKGQQSKAFSLIQPTWLYVCKSHIVQIKIVENVTDKMICVPVSRLVSQIHSHCSCYYRAWRNFLYHVSWTSIKRHYCFDVRTCPKTLWVFKKRSFGPEKPAHNHRCPRKIRAIQFSLTRSC